MQEQQNILRQYIACTMRGGYSQLLLFGTVSTVAWLDGGGEEVGGGGGKKERELSQIRRSYPQHTHINSSLFAAHRP